ncbi:DUF6578 domain-containing protein [Streptomyces sp. NPDC014734]|uniref:DUF6578 domain-containing protein n=1 Tax=Streptomyces sp. NPDC014734 TaxID=3364886 RepID=UPI0036F7F02B
MTATVWVDDWQIQCCGQSFAPGDVVSWTLLEVDPEDYADIVGGERAAGIDFCEEHHGRDEGRAPVRLEVLSVDEVHCHYEVPAGSASNIHHPVPGTTVLVPVEAADGRAEARPGLRFVGYLVTARRATDVAGGSAVRGQ